MNQVKFVDRLEEGFPSYDLQDSCGGLHISGSSFPQFSSGIHEQRKKRRRCRPPLRDYAMTLRRVFAILLFLQLFNIGVRPTLDPDMWWHLRTGEFIWHNGIPHHDVFSFTVRDHEWITHEWLSEALMWPVYAVGGLPALSLAFALLAACAFWLVYGCSEGQPYLAGLLVLLGSFTAAPSFGVRPQMFNLVLTAAFASVLDGFKRRALCRRTLLWLPLLTVVWANLHAGYLLGVVLVGTYAAGASLDRLGKGARDDQLAWSDVRWLAIVAVLCLVAALANPNGWRLWTYPFGTLGSGAMQQNIAEWRSPDFHQYIYWPFATMLALGVVSWMVAPARPCATDVLLFLGTGAAGLVSVRHIALFGVVAPLVLARSLTGSLRHLRAWPLLTGRTRSSAGARKAVLNWTILAVGVFSIALWDVRKLAQNDAAIAGAFPVAAVEFIEREGLAQQRGYNTYIWGGYLIWRGIPAFVDGRPDVYGDDFVFYYLKTFRLTDEWRKPLDDFGVTYVLVERANPLATLLAASGQWREAYADKVARVFVRNGTSP
jgi:hypothetical protein